MSSPEQGAPADTPWSRWVGSLLPVMLGGMVGTGLRWGVVEVALALADTSLTPIAAIAVVNVAGAGVLGWWAPQVTAPRLRAFAFTGVLGSFTTWSAFVVDAVVVVRLHGSVALAGLHVVITLAFGLGAARAGLRRGRAAVQPAQAGVQ